MQQVWESPAEGFWRRLLNGRVDDLVNDPKKVLLRHMRHDHVMVKRYQRRFGPIFRERGLNLYKLIADACGEVWDNEDEEKGMLPKKTPPRLNKGNAVSLDCAREVGLRQDQGQGGDVPGRDGPSEEDVQEEGCCGRRTRARGPQETETPG